MAATLPYLGFLVTSPTPLVHEMNSILSLDHYYIISRSSHSLPEMTERLTHITQLSQGHLKPTWTQNVAVALPYLGSFSHISNPLNS